MPAGMDNWLAPQSQVPAGTVTVCPGKATATAACTAEKLQVVGFVVLDVDKTADDAPPTAPVEGLCAASAQPAKSSIVLSQAPALRVEGRGSGNERGLIEFMVVLQDYGKDIA